MSRYCPACREHFEGEGPPYGVIHVSADEHLHAITREPVEKIVEPEPPDVAEGVVVLRRGALVGHFQTEDSLAAYLDRCEDVVQVMPRIEWVQTLAERLAVP